jgi:hypothetical protein
MFNPKTKNKTFFSKFGPHLQAVVKEAVQLHPALKHCFHTMHNFKGNPVPRNIQAHVDLYIWKEPGS